MTRGASDSLSIFAWQTKLFWLTLQCLVLSRYYRGFDGQVYIRSNGWWFPSLVGCYFCFNASIMVCKVLLRLWNMYLAVIHHCSPNSSQPHHAVYQVSQLVCQSVYLPWVKVFRPHTCDQAPQLMCVTLIWGPYNTILDHRAIQPLLQAHLVQEAHTEQ